MIAILAAAALQAGAAPAPVGSAPQTQSMPRPITMPDWVRRPSSADLSRHFPRAAARDHLAGSVVLTCAVNASGRLVDCNADDPGDFGQAALRMAPLFQMRPTQNGVSVAGGQIRIPIQFLLQNNIRSAPITVKDAEIHGATVEVDCRYQGVHLDNCFVRYPGPGNVAETAIRLAADVTLPPMPRPRGRIVLPLVFPPKDGVAVADAKVISPRWNRRPSALDVARVYPAAARRAAVDGAASVSCVVTAEGRLTDCKVEAETPAGPGFGEAALQLTPLFRMEPLDAFGIPVQDRTIRIPIQFRPMPPRRGVG